MTAAEDTQAQPGPGDLAEAAVAACQRLLGIEARPVAPARSLPVHYKRRQFNSIRLAAGSGTLIVTRRKHPRLAVREALALRTLHAGGAPVPKVLAADGVWLIQEDLGPTRLAQKLQDVAEREGIGLLDAATEALWRCQEAGEKAALGAGRANIDGYEKLLAAPARLAKILRLPAPPFSEVRMRPLIRAPESAFVRWDARPANAIVTSSGAIFWIDWEEWGRRCRLDDLVWLICDEWVPDWPEAEDELIERQIRSRVAKSEMRGAEIYFGAFGTLHLLHRLVVIMRAKGQGGWWDEEACHAHDLIGVTQPCALRLVSRAARLAAKVGAFRPLAAWIRSLPGRIPA